MTTRKAHGAAARLGRLTASELTPADELRPATPAPAARGDRDAAGRFVLGNRAGTAQRVRAGRRGALVELERKGDAAARAALAFGRRYSAHRRAELARAHGGEISAGVGAMVESAGDLLASSRYWSARSIAESSPDFARLAAQLVAGSRQAERDAWELAAREAEARPRRLAWLEEPTATSSATHDAFSDADPAEGATPKDDAQTGQPDGENAGGES